jgi:DNA topoisomerase III
VTAQLECLLDDVVVGKQEMVGAIDAVCEVAQRIIGKLKEGTAAGGPPLLGAVVSKDAGGYPPTPAMKRFADSLARQKGVKPPPSYKTSILICRAFLNQHAPHRIYPGNAEVDGLCHSAQALARNGLTVGEPPYPLTPPVIRPAAK